MVPELIEEESQVPSVPKPHSTRRWPSGVIVPKTIPHPNGISEILRIVLASQQSKRDAPEEAEAARQLDDKTFATCLSEYKAEGLELPPHDAPYVFTLNRDISCAGFYLGYLSQGGEFRIGTETVIGPYPGSNVELTSEVLDTIPLYAAIKGAEIEIGIPTALVLYERGQIEPARRLFSRALINAWTHKGTLADIPPGTKAVDTIPILAKAHASFLRLKFSNSPDP